MEAILHNLVVTMKVLHMNIFRAKYNLNLITSNILFSKIVHKHNHTEHQMSLHQVAGQTLLETRECTLKSTHTPLTGLAKQRANIVNPKEVVTDIVMKMSYGSFCHRPIKGPVCVPTPGGSLVDTYFIAPNL
jgi:hypothetical protein